MERPQAGAEGLGKRFEAPANLPLRKGQERFDDAEQGTFRPEHARQFGGRRQDLFGEGRAVQRHEDVRDDRLPAQIGCFLVRAHQKDRYRRPSYQFVGHTANQKRPNGPRPWVVITTRSAWLLVM